MADEKANGQGETEAKKPTCFVVSPIGATGSPERKHANVTLKFIITPVLERCGFQMPPLRSDTLGEPGIISRQIISQLLNADLVIADLTDKNPNVYYELAIRHGTGKPFVQLITKGQVLPFDIGHQRTIFFDRTDLEDVEECKAELERQVKAVMVPGFKVETPIGQTLDYEKLRSGGSVEQALAKLADQVGAMNRESRASDQTVRGMARRKVLADLFADPSDDGFEKLVSGRIEHLLNERGFIAKPPLQMIRDATSHIRALVSSTNRLDMAEIDTILSRLIDHLVTPKEAGPA